ncbi:predicted protein [Sclerotinia sclerotiorum 1980 UF-70]|uniref:Clr5 domain-containing protein n=1 Tax=Sclerotinia sclerotiorum (strain ATCC 18683 / 1980 / Ss-1) TaxID=665079 RepID=A7ER78_SCLS1|nr:predicted protein [Sclerotinia sclerotiorum 1980 UF-70]EDN91970.1 predicted protein [Sclerotinia sclerotiorum 1980 UF-70]
MANTQQQTPKPPGPKRARDHATITSNKWTDHENLLFQLYVTEKKSYKEVRRIMNEKCKWSARGTGTKSSHKTYPTAKGEKEGKLCPYQEASD